MINYIDVCVIKQVYLFCINDEDSLIFTICGHNNNEGQKIPDKPMQN